MPAIATAATGPQTIEREAVLPNDDAQVQFHVLAGELAAGRDQPALAARQFLKALDIAPDAELAGRATVLALGANDEPLALEAAQRWIALDSTSLEAREVILRLSLRAGRLDAADAQARIIVVDHPGGPDDGYRHIAALLSQEPAHAAAALRMMASLVEDDPGRAGAWHAQGLLALRYNDLPTAERAAREAVRLAPKDQDAALLLVGVLVRLNALPESERILEAQVRNNPLAGDIRIGYARLLLEARHAPEAIAQLERVLKAEPEQVDARFLLAVIDLSEDRIDAAERRFSRLVDDDDRGQDARYYLGRIAESRQDPDAALRAYARVTGGNHRLDATMRQAQILGRKGRIPDARAIWAMLREQYPPMSARFDLSEAQMLAAADDLGESARVLGRALERTPDDAELLYARSLIFERQGELARAEADLRRILALKPADARALNALGFMLVVHTDRLDEAETLIGRALALTPDEPSVIDSMGWLRFRQGRPAEAVALLARAYAEFPDPEVAAHFGEALWASGDRVQAKNVLDRAIEQAPEHPLLRNTVERLLR